MRRLGILALLFGAYVVSARIGLSFATIHPSATAIWPPSGIALAAFLFLGRDAWPAVFAGAFAANVGTTGSIASIVGALGIAVGNTLEGALGGYLVNRFARGRQAFERPQDIFRFSALAGLLGPMVSATIGVTTLSFVGTAPWNEYGSIWVTWWLGDMAGVLLVTPLFLVWRDAASRPWGRRQFLEAALLVLTLIVTAGAVFGGFYTATRNYPLAFFCIPALVWTAFRFGQLETAIALLILSGVATWGTLRGLGPFGVSGPNEQLLVVQTFMG